MATTTKAVKANAKNTKADAKKTAADATKTTRSAIGAARTTAENVQRDLVDTAGDVKESVQNVFLAGLGALSLAEEEGSKLFKKLVKKGEKVDLPGLGGARIHEVRKQLDVAAEDAQDAVKTRVSDARYVATETADKLEDRVSDAVATVMKRVGVPTREEISELTASVERLTAHIDTLRKQREDVPVVTMDTSLPQPAVAAVGGGWYEIRVGDVVVEKVQGKDEADAALARMNAAQA